VPGGLTEIPTTFSLTQQGDEAAAALDDLVELVAAYGFDFRTEAEASVAGSAHRHARDRDRYRARRIHYRNGLRLFAQQADLGAVRVAERVAAGNFADDIAVRRRDELGRL
jgi:methyl-accepting chemotaxis protein